MLVQADYCRDVRGMVEKKQRAGQKEEGFCLSEAAGLASGRWRAAPSLPVHGLKDVNDGGMVGAWSSAEGPWLWSSGKRGWRRTRRGRAEDTGIRQDPCA